MRGEERRPSQTKCPLAYRHLGDILTREGGNVFGSEEVFEPVGLACQQVAEEK